MGKTPHTNTTRLSLLIHSTRQSVVILKLTGYVLLSTSIVKCVVKLQLGASTVVWVVDSTSPTPRVVLAVLAGSGATLLAFAESVKGNFYKSFSRANKKSCRKK